MRLSLSETAFNILRINTNIPFPDLNQGGTREQNIYIMISPNQRILAHKPSPSRFPAQTKASTPYAIRRTSVETTDPPSTSTHPVYSYDASGFADDGSTSSQKTSQSSITRHPLHRHIFASLSRKFRAHHQSVDSSSNPQHGSNAIDEPHPGDTHARGGGFKNEPAKVSS